MTPLTNLLVESREEFDRETDRLVAKSLRDPSCKPLTELKNLQDSFIRKAYLLGLEDVLAAVSTNGGQDIIEMGNVTDPIGAANHKGYMKCIEHTEVILKKRIKEALDSAIGEVTE